jgi:hypothetical protein
MCSYNCGYIIEHCHSLDFNNKLEAYPEISSIRSIYLSSHSHEILVVNENY